MIKTLSDPEFGGDLLLSSHTTGFPLCPNRAHSELTPVRLFSSGSKAIRALSLTASHPKLIPPPDTIPMQVRLQHMNVGGTHTVHTGR